MFSRCQAIPLKRKSSVLLTWNRLQGNCLYCSFQCQKAFDLAIHLSREHSLKTHHCQYCDKIFCNNKSVFVKHIRKHLLKNKSFGYSFTKKFFKAEKSQSELYSERKCDGKTGIQKLSNREKYFVMTYKHDRKENSNFPIQDQMRGKCFTCHLCGKQFSHSTGLSYHLKHVHEGIKEHECDICGRKFALKAARDDHRRIHTGERPFICHTCGKTFKTKASLYIHNKTHTDSFPHTCTYCQRKFRWRQQLLGHITTHTGEKKHFCEICGKGFGVKNDLTRHKLVHSQEKPFMCLLCGLSFGQKRYLKNHEKTKHKK